MRFVPRFSRMLPPALWRPAVFLAALAQILLGVAPITEIRSGDDAGAHVESAGTQLHHSHTDANCPACVGQHLLATAEPRAPAHYAISGAKPHAARSAIDLGDRVAGRASWSRAPPLLF